MLEGPSIRYSQGLLYCDYWSLGVDVANGT